MSIVSGYRGLNHDFILSLGLNTNVFLCSVPRVLRFEIRPEYSGQNNMIDLPRI